MVSRKRKKIQRGPGIVATLRDPDKIRATYIIVGLALVFGGSLGFGATQCDNRKTADAGTGKELGDSIATINGKKISRLEFDKQYENMRERMKSQDAQSSTVIHPPEYYSDLRYRTLRQMLDMEFFDMKADETGITIIDEQVEEKVDYYRKMLVPAKTLETDRSLLQRALDSLGQVKEEKSFEIALQRIDPTLSVAKLRDISRQELMAEAYVNKLKEQVLTESVTTLEAKANSVRTEIENGTEFAVAAIDNSDDEESKNTGGMVKGVKHDSTNLPKPVIDTIFGLPVGELSQPIRNLSPDTQVGVWLVKVENRTEATGEQWDAEKENVRTRLLEQKRNDVEEGVTELPPDGNIVVSDDEVKNAYEQADARVIFFKADDPMNKVYTMVNDEVEKTDIRIFDPELRATHNIVNEKYGLAVVDYYEAIRDNRDNLRTEPGQDNTVGIEYEEARLRYLLSNLYGTVAFRAEAKWQQDLYQKFQENPDSFSGIIPEVPQDIKENEQGYFVAALLNLDYAVKINKDDPWSRIQRVSIDLAREQVSPRLINDLGVAHDLANRDFNLEYRVLSSIRQAISLDDKALDEAGGKRPETWTPPVLPESELGITLESQDALFEGMTDTELGPIPADEKAEPAVESGEEIPA
ncbi:MAG: SurA N-terminal domain-containing protein, partial [bacterium]